MKSKDKEQKPENAPQPTRRKGFRVRADAKAASPSRHSLTLRLGDDGTPQWDKLSESTREAWREVLRHSETAKLGLSPSEPATVTESEPVSPETVAAFYTVLGGLEARIFSRIYKIPLSLTQQIFSYGKNELSLLVPPTQRVIGKYAPLVISKYGDEIALAVLLASITQAKISACSRLSHKERAKHEQEKHGQEEGEPVKANGQDSEPFPVGAEETISEFEVRPGGENEYPS